MLDELLVRRLKNEISFADNLAPYRAFDRQLLCQKSKGLKTKLVEVMVQEIRVSFWELAPKWDG